MTGAKVFFVRECSFVYSVCAKLYFLAPDARMHGYLLQNDQFFICAPVKFYLSHKVTSAVNNGDSVTVTALDKKEQEIKIDADYCLVAIGRKPYTEGLGLEKVGIKVTEKGQIETCHGFAF